MDGAQLHRFERWMVGEVKISSYRAARIVQYVAARFEARRKPENKLPVAPFSCSVTTTARGNQASETQAVALPAALDASADNRERGAEAKE